MIESARYTQDGSILAVIDGEEVTVPDDMGNRHRAEIAAWAKKSGNKIKAHSDPAPVLSVDDYRLAIKAHVDATAVARNYDDAPSMASYVSSTIPEWAAEAVTFVAWRDQVWSYAYAELAKFSNAAREAPTVQEFLEELPQIVW